jgi:hypothetical protein
VALVITRSTSYRYGAFDSARSKIVAAIGRFHAFVKWSRGLVMPRLFLRQAISLTYLAMVIGSCTLGRHASKLMACPPLANRSLQPHQPDSAALLCAAILSLFVLILTVNGRLHRKLRAKRTAFFLQIQRRRSSTGNYLLFSA